MSENINILLDVLPEAITVDDEEYPISSNFRTFMLLELLLRDKSLSDERKLEEMVYLIFGENYPKNITADVIDKIIDFYRCGKKETKRQKAVKKTVKNKKRVYDFEWDDAYIYSAFYSTYRIDLNEIDYLHWWKFKALFDALPSDCEFVKIMGYRATDISSIKDKSERARIAKLQALYALPEQLTAEEKAAQIGALFGGGIR